MPLTQERMLAVLDEAEQFIVANKVLVGDIREVLHSANLSQTQKLEVIAGLIAMQMPQPFNIVIERRHFNRYGRHNERMKEKMNAKRQLGTGEQGVVRRKTPQTSTWRGPSQDYSHLQEKVRAQTPPGQSPFAEDYDKDDDAAPRLPMKAIAPPPPDSPAERAVPGLTQRIVELASSTSTEEEVMQRQREMYMMTISEFPKGEQERMLARWEAEKGS